MTIEASSLVVAGWYPDPAGTPQMRWWSGESWTDHLAPVAQPVEIAQTATAEPASSAPAEPYRFDSSPSAPLRYDPTTKISTNGPISNRPAWLSLGLGIVALGLVVAHLVSGQGGFIVTLSGLTSIIWGIVAIVRKGKGIGTVLWAPILGILFGATATLISAAMLLGMFQPTAAAPASTGGSTSILGATGPHVYPTNPILSSVQAEESSIATTLEDTVAGGGTKLAAGDSWPIALNVGADNRITTPSGDFLGTLPVGMTMQYSIDQNSNFVLQMHGANAAEVSIYTSSNNMFTVSCPTSDKSCTPA
jgi:hypothetical protein